MFDVPSLAKIFAVIVNTGYNHLMTSLNIDESQRFKLKSLPPQ